MIINPYRFGQPLLLDLYPNAAVAYSVRKLRTAYSGAALRVRRSSDNAESDIGFVANQLDTTSLLSFVGAGSGFVTTWYDQSGNGNNLTQTTAANQPRIVNAGILITRGAKPAITFDGSNDCLVTIQNNSYTFTGPVTTICITSKNSGYAPYETIFSAGSTGNATTNQDKCMVFGFSTDGRVIPNPSIVIDIWRPSGVQYDGTISTNERRVIGFYISNWSTFKSTGLSGIRSNGIDLPTKSYVTNLPTSLNSNPIKIGVLDEILAASYFIGDLQEIISYNTNQYSNRIQLETNINTYYTIY